MVVVLYFGTNGGCVFGGLKWGGWISLFQLGFLFTVVS